MKRQLFIFLILPDEGSLAAQTPTMNSLLPKGDGINWYWAFTAGVQHNIYNLRSCSSGSDIGEHHIKL